MTEIRFGIVSDVNYHKGTVKVVYTDLDITSPELIVFQGRNKGTKEYSMPEPGEQGLCLISENGGQSFYLGSGYNGQEPVMSNSGKGKFITLYPDGTLIQYDTNASKLNIHCVNEIEIEVPKFKLTSEKIEVVSQNIDIQAQNINVQAQKLDITSKTQITGDTNIDGALGANQGVKAKGDVTADGVSLKTHTHNGVKAGGDKTGIPG